MPVTIQDEAGEESDSESETPEKKAPITPQPAQKNPQQTTSQTPAPTPTPPSTLIETQLTWPQTVDVDKTNPLIKVANNSTIDLFNEAEKKVQENQSMLKNLESLRNTLAQELIENMEKAQSLISEITYKKGIIMNQLIQFEKDLNKKR